MEDIKIVEEQLPVIRINFDQIKAGLTETLKIYSGIVVTEETLSGCKSTQKELAGIRIKLDTYRKDKKKELSRPIEAFENQCKELVALIEQAEQPIKDGIKVFDDMKREEKRKVAEELIKVVIAETEINKKYGSRLDVLETYCGLSKKESEVKNDLEVRAMVLKVEQDREAELIEIIKDTIDTENRRITAKIKFEDFQRLIDRGMATKDILAEVKSRVDSVYRAENPPKVEPVVEPILETYFFQANVSPVIEPQTEPIPKADDTTYYAVYRITGSEQTLLSVSQFLKVNGITYKVTEQGEI